MSDNPMSQAADTMKTGMQNAATAATDMGRTMMEKGMANMAEMQRMFSDMKFPAMGGMDTVMQAQRRNLEAMSSAYRVALEGAQAIGKRNMEIMQQTMSEMSEAMRELTTQESPQARAARQADMLKAAYERAVAHIREMADLIQRSNSEALEMLNKRFTEALDEVKQLAAKGTSEA